MQFSTWNYGLQWTFLYSAHIVTYQKSNMDNNKWRERNKCRYCHNNIDSHLLTRPLTRYGSGKEMHLFILVLISYAAFVAVVFVWWVLRASLRTLLWTAQHWTANVSSLSTASNNRLNIRHLLKREENWRCTATDQRYRTLLFQSNVETSGKQR